MGHVFFEKEPARVEIREGLVHTHFIESGNELITSVETAIASARSTLLCIAAIEMQQGEAPQVFERIGE